MGEERYSLINLMAVLAGFLEDVDIGAVGVGEGIGIVRLVFQLHIVCFPAALNRCSLFPIF